MSADLLREAASLMRERAGAVISEEPWTFDAMSRTGRDQ